MHQVVVVVMWEEEGGAWRGGSVRRGIISGRWLMGVGGRCSFLDRSDLGVDVDESWGDMGCLG